MVEKKITILNESGFHARPASLFVALTKKFVDSQITITKVETAASTDAKSILGVMALGLNKGTEVSIQVTGENEEETLQAIIHFLDALKTREGGI